MQQTIIWHALNKDKQNAWTELNSKSGLKKLD